MMKCPNSSHSAGLNACKSRAAVNIKRQSANFQVFTMVCYHCHTVFFQYMLHKVTCLLHRFMHLWH